MATYSVSKTFSWQGKITEKVTFVCRMFGLTIERLKNQRRTHSCRVEINPGNIVYITGPSGSGKSVLLRELEKVIPSQDRLNLEMIKLPNDGTVIDCIDTKDVGVLSALRLLSTAGLNDCFCILNQPSNLSEGEQYRFRLACALAAGKKFIFADEFTSTLDRITASSISYRLRQFADKTGTTFILASSHEDMLLDLAPDVLIRRDFTSPPNVIYRKTRSSKCLKL
jgi:ABC-type ATPase with predicted acetyltransferase domain